MVNFVQGPDSAAVPFGRNEYLRSVKDVKRESFTFAASTMPVTGTDNGKNQKVAQPGLVMAKITSGPQAGKIGPFQAGVTDGRQTAANIVGVLDTFLPWQLLEGDAEVAVTYQGTLVQAWCFELNSSGAYVALGDVTAAALVAKKGLNVNFADGFRSAV